MGLRSKLSQVLALINLVWNGLLALTIWMVLELSLFLKSSNLIPLGICVLIGLWLLTRFLYGTLSRTRVEIKEQEFQLQKWLLGSCYAVRHLNLNINNGESLVVREAKPCRRLCILLATNTQFKCMTAYQTVKGNTGDIDQVDLKTIQSPISNNTLRLCVFKLKHKDIIFGTLLTPLEKKWIMKEMGNFVKKIHGFK
ncbi:MAG: hypothetical protein RH949_05630 [Coleofasciculus sp. A1-SPW-01]|uniref:hypothetical protein n=1 Tax=Coleofasciculus sp. A1-SPW-01 TaxID=3070819 RepID=UPI0033008220